jgi:hypothetical protein
VAGPHRRISGYPDGPPPPTEYRERPLDRIYSTLPIKKIQIAPALVAFRMKPNFAGVGIVISIAIVCSLNKKKPEGVNPPDVSG